jgi:hypothetical protein
MTRRKKLLLGIFLLVVVLTVGTVALGAATAIGQGVVHVQVDSDGRDGNHFGLAVPAVLIDVALWIAPLHLVVDEIPMDEIRPYLPLMSELSRQIEELPDAVFVEVTGPGETVRIEKNNGRFVIDVTGSGERVHVSVPVSVVTRLVRTAQRLA